MRVTGCGSGRSPLIDDRLVMRAERRRREGELHGAEGSPTRALAPRDGGVRSERQPRRQLLGFAVSRGATGGKAARVARVSSLASRRRYQQPMASSVDAVEQYSELAGEHDRLRLYGVLRLEPQRVAKVFLVDDGHTHLLVHARVGCVEKWGRPAVLLNNGASWEDLLRFNIAVVPSRRHPLNLVQLTLYSVNSNNPGAGSALFPQPWQPKQLCEVGAVVFHLHDMLRATDDGRVSDSFLFWNDFQTVGELHLGVNFAYGEFGRGRSERIFWAHGTGQAESDEEEEEQIDNCGNAATHPECSHADEIDESRIAECFESLYLAAATQDNEIKAARAGNARMESFLHSHSQLPTREERLAFVRHQVEAPAMQLQQRHSATASQTQGENGRGSGGTQDDLARHELPMLPSGLLPLSADVS